MEALKKEVKTSAFWWFICLSIVLYSGLEYLLACVGIFGNYYSAFKRALIFGAVSFGFSLYWQNGAVKFNQEYLRKVVMDENLQYFLMAVSLTFALPSILCLVPFEVIAFFHFIGYFDRVILNIFTIGAKRKAQLKAAIKQLSEARVTILNFISSIEIIIIPILFLQIFSGGSILVPFMYYQVYKMRFTFAQDSGYKGVMYPYSLQAVRRIGAQLDQVFLHQYSPSIVQTVYNKIKGYISQVQLPQQPQPQAQ